jgi:TRAP-type C4-dicarboxylate transport system permease large subunit
VLGRNIGEAMFVGFVVVGLFAGRDAPTYMWNGLVESIHAEITFAALAFILMSFVLAKTPVLGLLIDILNSFLGRLRGGPVYCTMIAGAAFGAVAHVGASMAAVVGSVTVPWMKRSGVSGELSATVVAGSAGMGLTFPFSATMFILVGSSAVGGLLSPDEIMAPLAVAGLWCLGYRLLLNFYLIRKNGLQPLAAEDRIPAARGLRAGWTSLLLLVPLLVPLTLTYGPVAGAVGRYAEVVTSEALSIITWIPVLMIVVVLVLGRRALPCTGRGWWDVLAGAAPQSGIIGATLVAAFSASSVLAQLQLPQQLTRFLESLSAPTWAMAILVGVIIVVVAIPLTASATIAAVGPVAVVALVEAGVAAPVAAAAVMVFASTEGASPPSGAPIHIAAGIARIDPSRIFIPLLTYFCIPILGIGVAIALGHLPVWTAGAPSGLERMPMIYKVAATLFRLSTVAFLLGGLVVVVAQAVGLVLGDGRFVTGIDVALSPTVYACAGVSGLLAFAMSYAKSGAGSEAGEPGQPGIERPADSWSTPPGAVPGCSAWPPRRSLRTRHRQGWGRRSPGDAGLVGPEAPLLTAGVQDPGPPGVERSVLRRDHWLGTGGNGPVEHPVDVLDAQVEAASGGPPDERRHLIVGVVTAHHQGDVPPADLGVRHLPVLPLLTPHLREAERAQPVQCGRGVAVAEVGEQLRSHPTEPSAAAANRHQLGSGLRRRLRAVAVRGDCPGSVASLPVRLRLAVLPGRSTRSQRSCPL